MRRSCCLVAVCVVLGSALTACSSDAALPPTFTGVRVDAVPTTQAQIASTGVDDDLREKRPTGAVLDGPHYTLRLGWISTGTMLSSRDADELDTTAVRAPKGQQLVVAAVDANDTYAAYEGGEVAVSVAVAGSETQISQLPLPYKQYTHPSNTILILVSAPRNAELRLRAEDTGRSEELDLRTGKVLTDSYQMRQSKPVHWSGSAPVACPSNSGTMAGKLKVLNADYPQAGAASTTTYAKGVGWAPKGSTILTVPAPGLELQSTSGNLLLCGVLHEQISDPGVFTFRPRGGKAVPASSGKRDIDLDLNNLGADTSALTFFVPAGTRTGTVTMDLSKARLAVEATSSDDRSPASWSRAPGRFTLTVTL